MWLALGHDWLDFCDQNVAAGGVNQEISPGSTKAMNHFIFVTSLTEVT
jgi:hypothetical protein